MFFSTVFKYKPAFVGLLLPLLGACPSYAQATMGEGQGSFVTFAVGGSNAYDNPVSMNNANTLTGEYMSNAVHGFVRAGNGAVATFDVPGATNTEPTAISQAGAITGVYVDSSRNTHGFLRAALGSITTFNAPGSNPTDIIEPDSINAAGTITGSYGPAGGQQPHGFVRSASGTITTFDVSGSIQTLPSAINELGVVTGYWEDNAGGSHGFVRSASGSLVSFDVPGSPHGTLPWSINTAGTIAGVYYDYSGNFHVFTRSSSGAFTTFDAPAGGSPNTNISINALGIVAGEYQGANSLLHGFVRTPDGVLTSFDVPGASSTFPVAIDDFGVISGAYQQGNGNYLFLRIPTGAQKLQSGAFDINDGSQLYIDGGFYLYGDSTVRLWTLGAGNPSQHWQFGAVSGGYILSNLGTGQSASDQSGILREGSQQDVWTVTQVPDGYSIQNNRTGRFLTDPAVQDGAVTLTGWGSAWQLSSAK